MEIRIRGEIVASLELDGSELTASRTAGGFKFDVPAKITIMAPLGGSHVPMLSGLHGVLSVHNPSEIEIGCLRATGTYLGASTQHDIPGSLVWRGPLQELAFYEKIRQTKPPSLRVQIWGEVFLLKSAPNQPLRLDEAPTQFYGTTQLTVPVHIWASALRKVGVIDAVFLEISNPVVGPPALKRVWESLQDAKDSFDEGGESGWRSCGVHVREALTAWQDEVPLDLGKNLANSDLTKDQRLDNLRNQVRMFTHITAHPDPKVAKSWTRNDALLALGSLCTLLAAKNV